MSDKQTELTWLDTTTGTYSRQNSKGDWVEFDPIAEIDRLKAINECHVVTLKGIAEMPISDGERMQLWASDALSGYVETVDESLLRSGDEVNRLKAVNAELVEALETLIESAFGGDMSAMQTDDALENAAKAIANAKGEGR